MTKRAWRRVLFALIPTVLVLGLLEGAGRIYEGAERRARERATQASEPDLARRGRETLIYVYGESTVWGTPVPEVGLVRQMAHYASRRHPGADIRFVNLGRTGLDSDGLRDLFEETIGMRPDLAVVLCGHNEYLRAAPQGRVAGALSGIAMARVASKFAARTWPGLRTKDVLPNRVAGVDRAGGYFRKKRELYFENMKAVVRAAKDADVPLLLGTLPCNLREWPPVFRRLDRAADDPTDVAAMDEAVAAADRGDVATLRAFVAGPASARPDDATFRFLRGRLRLLDGDKQGALDDLVFARDEDPLPWRCSSTLNDFVRTLARDERTLFADLDAELRAGGPPGFDLVCDNCHPSPEGARLMALALLRAAEGARVLPSPAADVGDLAEFLVAAGYAPGTPLRRRWLLENGRYLIKTPDFNLRLAHRVFDRAVAEFPQSWEAKANLATVLIFEGRVEEGTRGLTDAAELRGAPLDPSDRESVPYLYEALQARSR